LHVYQGRSQLEKVNKELEDRDWPGCCKKSITDHDGKQALEFLFGQGDHADRKQYPLPDIILLDLKMPGIDGHEVLRQIKRTDKLKRILVIILTFSRDEEGRTVSYDNGANSYPVKPVSVENFLKVVKQVSDYWLTLNV